MKHFSTFYLITLFTLHLTEAKTHPNVLLLCIDDLRPELNCYGADYIHSPNIDALAAKSSLFTRHYVQSPSCGPSRYSLLTGLYGIDRASGNNALIERGKNLSKDPGSEPASMPKWFKDRGYTTISIGKVSHHPGGMGGHHWDDPKQLEMPFSWDKNLMPCGAWRHPRGAMHGLANGLIRPNKKMKGAKKMDAIESFDGPDTAYNDGLITNQALKEIKTLSEKNSPFFLAVGLIRPHLPFGAPAKYMEPYKDAKLPPIPHAKKPAHQTTWHSSGEFHGQYNHHGKDPNTNPTYADTVRRHYAACVSYVDAQVGKILTHLEKQELADNTIVILWGDHGWHLGEHAIWGKHALFEESLHSPLLIHNPTTKSPSKKINTVVESIDLFPTLCDLARLPQPDFTDGESLLPIIQGQPAKNDYAISHLASKKGPLTIRTDQYRLIKHHDGYLELYDHHSPEKETVNIAADNPELIKNLLVKIQNSTPSQAPAE